MLRDKKRRPKISLVYCIISRCYEGKHENVRAEGRRKKLGIFFYDENFWMVNGIEERTKIVLF